MATIIRDFDSFGRPSRLRIADSDYDQTYAYDSAGRLSGIGIPGSTITYSYTPDSLDAGYSVLTPSNAVLTRALTRDPLRRGLITVVSNYVTRVFELPPSERGVAQSAGGSIPGVDRGSPPSFVYTYDALGRPVTRNLGAFGYNTRSEVAWARYGTNTLADIYDYDFIGNFTSNRLRGAWSQFTANELNEYATSPDNTPRSLAYDADGNLLTNGVWSYSYDSQNRLSSIVSNGVLVSTEIYDADLRRVGSLTASERTTFLYDGWNVIRDVEDAASSFASIDRYWGKDLSGSLQGAGGVGGLISESSTDSPFYPSFDNLGNVISYSTAVGELAALYTFDVFGNSRKFSSFGLGQFRYAFATKPNDFGLYYYGYRFYTPKSCKWISRDLIFELGGYNLFAASLNSLIHQYDYLGLKIDPWNKNQVEELAKKVLDPNKETICAAAKDRCVPGGLLAGIILLEQADLDFGETLGEMLGLGMSLGLAQIRIDTAISHGLTDCQRSQFRDTIVHSHHTTIVITAQMHFESCVRRALLNKTTNIEAAAELLKQHLSELCDRAKNGSITPSFIKDGANGGCSMNQICCLPGECGKQIAPTCLYAAMGSVWNYGMAITELSDVSKSAPASIGHGESLAAMPYDFDHFCD